MKGINTPGQGAGYLTLLSRHSLGNGTMVTLPLLSLRWGIKATDQRAEGTLPPRSLFLPRVCLGMVLKDRTFVPDLGNRNRLSRFSWICGYKASIQNTYLGMRTLARFRSRPTFFKVFYIYCLLIEVFLSWAISIQLLEVLADQHNYDLLKWISLHIHHEYPIPEDFIEVFSDFTKKLLSSRGLCSLKAGEEEHEVTYGSYHIKGSDAFYSLVAGVKA